MYFASTFHTICGSAINNPVNCHDLYGFRAKFERKAIIFEKKYCLTIDIFSSFRTSSIINDSPRVKFLNISAGQTQFYPHKT